MKRTRANGLDIIYVQFCGMRLAAGFWFEMREDAWYGGSPFTIVVLVDCCLGWQIEKIIGFVGWWREWLSRVGALESVASKVIVGSVQLRIE